MQVCGEPTGFNDLLCMKPSGHTGRHDWKIEPWEPSPPNDPQQLTLRFTMEAVVTLDPDRLEGDPFWNIVSAQYDLTSGEGRLQALSLYLTRYLERERLLADNPCTNGPASPTRIVIEFP